MRISDWSSDVCSSDLFSVFDTATLAGAALGQTVLARALQASKLGYEAESAHSAIYDAEKTADLFCLLVNRMQPLFDETTASGGARESDPSPAQMAFNEDNEGSVRHARYSWQRPC